MESKQTGPGDLQDKMGEVAKDTDRKGGDPELAEWGVQFATKPSSERKGEDPEVVEMMRKACGFYYGDDGLERTLQDWAFANCDGFAEQEGEDGDGEFTLEHNELHMQFKELLEQRLEEFVETELGITTDDFFAVVAADGAAHDAYSGSTFVRLINAATEFKAFFEMMCDAKIGCFVWGVSGPPSRALRLRICLHRANPASASPLPLPRCRRYKTVRLGSCIFEDLKICTYALILIT